LPPTGSWQDLKDHMREAGNVCYADVFKDGTGVVEFIRYDDMKYAVRNLDDTKFRSHEVNKYFGLLLFSHILFLVYANAVMFEILKRKYSTFDCSKWLEKFFLETYILGFCRR
jgi:hypothetical protein